MVFFARCVYKRVRKPTSTQTRRTLFVDTPGSDRERDLASGGRERGRGRFLCRGRFSKRESPVHSAGNSATARIYQQKPAELSAKNVR